MPFSVQTGKLTLGNNLFRRVLNFAITVSSLNTERDCKCLPWKIHLPMHTWKAFEAESNLIKELAMSRGLTYINCFVLFIHTHMRRMIGFFSEVWFPKQGTTRPRLLNLYFPLQHFLKHQHPQIRGSFAEITHEIGSG